MTSPLPTSEAPRQERRESRRYRRWLSGLLFLGAFVAPSADDLHNLLWYLGWISIRVFRSSLRSIPHFMYHALTPVVDLSVVTLILAVGITLVPYRRGERWAWWTMATAGLAFVGVKVWGSIVLYPHWTSQVALPLAVWLAAVALSWGDFRPHQSLLSGGRKDNL